MTRKLIDGDFTATHTLQVYDNVGRGDFTAVVQNKATGEIESTFRATDKEATKTEGRGTLKRLTQEANAKLEAKYDARAESALVTMDFAKAEKVVMATATPRQIAMAEQGLDENGKEWFEHTFYSAKVEEAYNAGCGPTYMVTLKTASEDGTNVVCTLTDLFDKKEAEAIAELYRKNGPTVLALLQATTMFPEPSDEWPDSSDIAQQAEQDARRTPIEVLADTCGLALDVLVPEQSMTVAVGDKTFHVTMEEITPPKPVLTFDSYAAWNAAVEARGLSTDSYVDGENGPSADDMYEPVFAYTQEHEEVGMFSLGAGEDGQDIAIAVLAETPLAYNDHMLRLQREAMDEHYRCLGNSAGAYADTCRNK